MSFIPLTVGGRSDTTGFIADTRLGAAAAATPRLLTLSLAPRPAATSPLLTPAFVQGCYHAWPCSNLVAVPAGSSSPSSCCRGPAVCASRSSGRDSCRWCSAPLARRSPAWSACLCWAWRWAEPWAPGGPSACVGRPWPMVLRNSASACARRWSQLCCHTWKVWTAWACATSWQPCVWYFPARLWA